MNDIVPVRAVNRIHSRAIGRHGDVSRSRGGHVHGASRCASSYQEMTINLTNSIKKIGEWFTVEWRSVSRRHGVSRRSISSAVGSEGSRGEHRPAAEHRGGGCITDERRNRRLVRRLDHVLQICRSRGKDETRKYFSRKNFHLG